MTYLILGLGLFFSVHLVPLVVPLRRRLVERLGRGLYLLLFALLSLGGLALMVFGLSAPSDVQLWAPMPGARVVALMLMPAAFVLLISAYLPGHLRGWLRHPMLIGVLLWAVAHLLANGDLKTSLLFGAFALYAILDIALSRSRPTQTPRGKPRWSFDGAAVLMGLFAFAGVLHAHGALFGVAILAG
ncbi:NnrU family protein [Motiliproteus sp. SC1-56]|uniref:NnrU family protein n=1 Tax=Motiliproteus sp. SC1-56 TaxID=2799565 RepID=UPI001A8F188D|nr:NnrU family protein [Motiliproteus sp. SC1-56]